jgi:glycosyltransferase involved in cell wall biosynthesis
MKVAFITNDNRETFKDYTAKVPNFGTAPEALLQGLAGMAGVEVHVVSCIRARLTSPEKLAPNIFFHSLYVPKIGWMRTFFFGCIRTIRKKLKEIQPDIVHGQGTEGECALGAVFSGFPNVLTIHGNMRLIAEVTHAKRFSYPWFAARLEGLTIPRSQGVVCITRYTRDAVSDLAKQTWLVPNAVDGTFFEVQSKPPADQPPRILSVGIICPRKNQNAFIRALDPLAKRVKFELLFLGQVSPGRGYDDEFLHLVKERSWCRHGGIASREQLKSQLREASLLALPSLEDNCPMAVLEAMAAGVPVVAANVGGVPDLVEDGKTGYFCDPLDPQSMSSAIEKALLNVSPTRELARQGNLQAQKRFHPQVIAERHIEIYREVLKGQGNH